MASPSARNTRCTINCSPLRRISSSTSFSSRARNFFCGAVYISQKVHWFHEQPLVTGRISEWASLGGRNTGSMYRMGNSDMRYDSWDVAERSESESDMEA